MDKNLKRNIFENRFVLYNKDKKAPTKEDLFRWLEKNIYCEKVVLKPIGFLGSSGSGRGTDVSKKFN